MTVDEFVKARVLPEFQPVVAALRELMRKEAPQATETISYGIPAFRVKRIIAVVSPTKKDITFSFSRGADFKDKYGLLKGVGAVSKFVKFKTPQEINREVLRYYIKQALELDVR